MQPSFPLPTDNFYKFACLFGLVLIVSSIFAFVAAYRVTLEQLVKYSEVVIALEARPERTRVEEDLLSMNKKLIEVSKANERTASQATAFVFGIGLLFSIYGAYCWQRVVQPRDDRIVELQIRKLTAEVARLEDDARMNEPRNGVREVVNPSAQV